MASVGAATATELISVLIADDDDEVRAALTELVARHDRLRLSAAVADGDAARVAADREHPHVAVLDVRMPAGGPELVRDILASSPSTVIIAYTAHGDPITERQMRAAGVTAFLTKGDRRTDLVGAILDAAGPR
jgi:two-component system response regulator DesR